MTPEQELSYIKQKGKLVRDILETEERELSLFLEGKECIPKYGKYRGYIAVVDRAYLNNCGSLFLFVKVKRKDGKGFIQWSEYKSEPFENFEFDLSKQDELTKPPKPFTL